MFERYSRQTIIREIGVEGQKRISRSCTLLIGCGALGSVIASALVRAGAGLKFIREIGLERISDHEQKLIKMLKEGLLKVPGLSVYPAGGESGQSPFLSLNINGYAPGEVGAILDQTFDIKVRTGLHCSPEGHKSLGTFPSGTVRISPGYFNTFEDMEIAIDAIRKIAES